VPSNGDTTDIRESPIIWLNDVGRGARFPQTIASIPIFRMPGANFSPLDLQRKELKAAFEDAVAAAKPPVIESLRSTHADLLAARQALADLATTLSTRRVDPDGTPDYTSHDTPSNMGTALDRCVDMVEDIARRRGFPLVPPAPGSEAAAGGGASSGESHTSAAPAGTREGLYRQLGEIAAALRRIEPHSPIPFLLERCVRLGAMPFPELMRAMIRESATIDDVERLLGIEKKE
jgi:type VI secretion system protein ImpA